MGQPSSNSDSSGNPEDFERRSSYVSEASVASQSTLRQDSPVLPPVPSFNGLSRGGSPERTARERQTLPSIFGNGARSSSGAYRREQLSPPRSSHDLGYSYSHTNRDSSPPLQADCMSYSNVHSRDYPYTMGQYLERSPFNSGSGNTLYPLSFDSNGDYDSKHKRRRGNLPKAVTDILRGWFADHLAHPYPTEEEKQMLMVQTGLAMSQVSQSDLFLELMETDSCGQRSVTGSSMRAAVVYRESRNKPRQKQISGKNRADLHKAPRHTSVETFFTYYFTSQFTSRRFFRLLHWNATK